MHCCLCTVLIDVITQKILNEFLFILKVLDRLKTQNSLLDFAVICNQILEKH